MNRGKVKPSRLNRLRIFVEHEQNKITTVCATICGIDWLRVKVIGVDEQAIATAVARLEQEMGSAISTALATTYIPSTGLLGPWPYRTPAVAQQEERLARAGGRKEATNG